MRKHTKLAVLLAVVSLFVPLSVSLAQPQEAREGIAQGNQNYMVAFEHGDGARAARSYTDGARILPPNSEPVSGLDAIQTFWQGVMDAGVQSVALETLEVESHGDTAHEVGTYLLGGDEDQVIDKGKYVVIWKHEAGQWKIYRGIWNSSLPAQTQ